MKQGSWLVWGLVALLGACAPVDGSGTDTGAAREVAPTEGVELAAAREEGREAPGARARVVTNDMVFLGSSTFNAAVAFGPGVIPARSTPVPFVSRTLDWHVLGSTGSLVHPALQPGTVNFATAGAITLDLAVSLNPNCQYNRFDFTIRGAPGHTGFPEILPNLMMVEVDGVGNTTATLVANTVLNPGFISSYEVGFTSAFSVTPFVPSPDRRYIVRLVNEYGAHALPGLTFRGAKAFGEVVTFGRTGEL